MKTVFFTAIEVLAFLLIATVCTTFVYVAVLGVFEWLSMNFDLTKQFPWGPRALTVLIFISSLIRVIRQRLPDLTRLTWDSGTVGDSPSAIHIPGGGGRLWNMNPLGPRSLKSIVSIISWFLCLGPSLAVTAVVTVVEVIRKRGA